MASTAASAPGVQSTHPFTCNTCQVAFRASELQRAHMQTDWHRYNLKRRVASLPPLPSEIFTEKVLANKASAAATAAKASFEKACVACQKTYYSENAYNNHLHSQKHKSNAAKAARGTPTDDAASVTGSVLSSAFSLGEPVVDSTSSAVDRDAEREFSDVVDGIKNTNLDDGQTSPISARPARPRHSDAEDRPGNPLSRTASNASTAIREPDPLLDCLFCNYRSPNFNLNVHHMSRFHGMFIPEKDFLVEPESLIRYLHEKIHTYNVCLKCHKPLNSAAGTQTHMRDRGHCMIAFESDDELVEIGEFYDFRSSYPDAEQFEAREQEAEDSDNSTSTAGGRLKLGASRKAVQEPADGDEDAGWETDSTVSSVPTDEITAIPIDDRSHRYKLLSQSRHHSHKDPRPHRAADGFHSHAHATPVAVYHDEYELHLPTGRTAGHRSLNKYYRQNLRNYPGVAERMEREQRRITGGSSDSEEDAEEDTERRGRGRQLVTRGEGGLGMVGVNDAKKAEVRAAEKRTKKIELRAQTKGLAMRTTNQQKHFRDHLLQ